MAQSRHGLKVVALQGYPVAPNQPMVGDTLVWDGVEWVPTPLTRVSTRSNVSRVGEVLNLDTIVVGLQGTPLSGAAPTNGEVLTFDGTQWVPATFSGEVGPPGPTGPQGPQGPAGPAGVTPQLIQSPDQTTALAASAANPQNIYYWV